MAEDENKFEGWAIVEIMGHNKSAGMARTVAFGGTVMLRVDIPELPEQKSKVKKYLDTPEGNYSLQTFEEILPAEPGRTEYIGMSSIFRLRPCTEETARAFVESMRIEKPKLLHVGSATEPAQLAGPADDEDDPEEERVPQTAPTDDEIPY